MFEKIFPAQIDNTYRGSKLGLWVFGAVALFMTAQSLNSLLNPYSVAVAADGIPVGTFGSAAANTFVALFALLGLAHFIVCLVCALVLIRYRSMVPLMFALVLLHRLATSWVLIFHPILRTGTPPGFYVAILLVVVLTLGLSLSLIQNVPQAGRA